MSAETAPPPDHDTVPPAPDPGTAEPKKKKHKAGTLRRALSWLRGRSKKKKPEVKQQQEGKGVSKADGDPPPIPTLEDEHQDNLFFPTGRTPVLEEIHNQAQEGLKSLQRREKQHGHSTASQDENKNPQHTHDNVDNGFRARSHSCTTENTDDAMSVRSEMIQRKGSTFRPHDSPSGRSGRRRKEKRATVVGVPHHIAAELGVQSRSSGSHRGIHDFFARDHHVTKNGSPAPVVNGKLGAEEGFVVIPTVDGKPSVTLHDGARVSLTTLEHTEATLQRHIDRVYQDDSCIGWKSGPKISPLLIRPKSLAVPGMTTHSPQSDHVGPVMCISPQATYMSKIIPNAVLPPMVDVVALTSSSVRTLSRCSLTTASPASVRGSLHRGRGQSFSSENWSRSQSTETIVSDSSTISSHGGILQEAGERHESGLSTGRASPAPSTGTQDGSDAASLCSGRSSIRSVSLRKSKKAPPPPKRTYSLQQQREMGLPPRPERKPVSKPNHSRDPWVLRTEGVMVDMDGGKLSSPSRSDRTLSPSSGYSSQSGTPTLPAKTLIEYPESPGTRRKTPPKPERSSIVKSQVVVSMTSPSSTENTFVFESPPRAGSTMGDQETQYVIPPHPKVPAPLCPPPSKTLGLTGKPGATPPPSPPPSHHPTPPPTRKSESDVDIPPATLEENTQRDPLWPPPPPEAPDEQDLSMADFPPPEDDIFLPLLPSLETEPHADHISDNAGHVVEGEKNEKHDVLKPNSTPVLYLATDSPSAPVLPLTTEPTEPSVPPSSVSLLAPPDKEPSNEVLGLITYKPHFVSSPTSTTIPTGPLKPDVPLPAAVDQSETTVKQATLTALTVSTVSASDSVTTAPHPVASTESANPLVPDNISPWSKPSVLRPVSAPGGSFKKVATPNQIVAPAQKEDANLPIVTPSLLQMVRLRSVQVRGPQVHSPQQTTGFSAPQKPIRKSLSHRSPPGLDSPSGEVPGSSSQIPIKHPDPGHSPSAHRSPASAASFVFARASRRFVFEPPASQEAEASLKKDLVTELKSHGGPRSPEGKPPIQRKPSKIPPPVARKPSIGMPRTPTSPQSPTAGKSGSISIPCGPGTTPPVNGTNVAVTVAGHEQQHESPAEKGRPV
ncbi:Hypothetical predicted protein [Pelobates cultripes]|uniref:KIAA1522 n=1 Tax=Pelobates cultripes TaxID=61616 RepID=A0AAD1R387_PELCU|nr:Hypothetical predicted protein [Pelobates cultripes]